MMTVCGFMEIPMGRQVGSAPNYDDSDHGWAPVARTYRDVDYDQNHVFLLSDKDPWWFWAHLQNITIEEPAEREFSTRELLWAQEALGAEMAADLETEITRNERIAARKIEINRKRVATLTKTLERKKREKEKEAAKQEEWECRDRKEREEQEVLACTLARERDRLWVEAMAKLRGRLTDAVYEERSPQVWSAGDLALTPKLMRNPKLRLSNCKKHDLALVMTGYCWMCRDGLPDRPGVFWRTSNVLNAGWMLR